MSTTPSGALSAVVARLIPGDVSSPGAVEAGVPDFVTTELTGAFAHAAEVVAIGLDALDAAALRDHGELFATLGPAEQDALLTAVETEPFFEVLLQLTIDGFLCDPVHGGNRDLAGWKVVGYPGVLMAPTEVDQEIGRPIPFTGTTVAEWRAGR